MSSTARRTGPYNESDTPNPLGTYGRTKLAGEEAVRASGIPHLLIRTSWIYGSRGHNFLHTMRRLSRDREELRVVDDQIGAPTWCRKVAEGTIGALDKSGALRDGRALGERGGLVHLTAAGATSWHGFTRAILRLDPERERQKTKRILPIPTADFPTPAPRPLNSRLDCTLFRERYGIALPPWDESLAEVMAELGERAD